MGRPIRVCVTLLEPRPQAIELGQSGCKRNTVCEIQGAVTQGEELRAKQVEPPERTENDGMTRKGRDESILPANLQITNEGCGAVVEPVIIEMLAIGSGCTCERARGVEELFGEVRHKYVAVARRSRDDAKQLERCTTDHDRLKAQAPLVYVRVEALYGVPRLHGIIIYDTIE